MKSCRYPVIRCLACLLLFALASCSTPGIYQADEINPGMPVNIGDEVIIEKKGDPGRYLLTVTGLDEESISGNMVENPDIVERIRWQQIDRLEIRDVDRLTKKDWFTVGVVWIALGLGFSAVAFH